MKQHIIWHVWKKKDGYVLEKLELEVEDPKKERHGKCDRKNETKVGLNKQYPFFQSKWIVGIGYLIEFNTLISHK